MTVANIMRTKTVASDRTVVVFQMAVFVARPKISDIVLCQTSFYVYSSSHWIDSALVYLLHYDYSISCCLVSVSVVNIAVVICCVEFD